MSSDVNLVSETLGFIGIFPLPDTSIESRIVEPTCIELDV
jgi:hypothetical protein